MAPGRAHGAVGSMTTARAARTVARASTRSRRVSTRSTDSGEVRTAPSTRWMPRTSRDSSPGSSDPNTS